MVCYKCDKKGHHAHECRTGKAKGKNVIGKKNIKCFNYDQIGNYNNQCKEPANEGRDKCMIGAHNLKVSGAGEGKGCFGRLATDSRYVC